MTNTCVGLVAMWMEKIIEQRCRVSNDAILHQREDISEQATRHGSVFSGYDMSGLAFR